MPTPPDPRRHDLSHRDTQIRRAILEALRREGLTQSWLAAESGRSRQFVSVKLSGMARLLPGDVDRFLFAMGSEVVQTSSGLVVVKCRTVVL